MLPLRSCWDQYPLYKYRKPRCELNINKHYKWENPLKKAIKVIETLREKVRNIYGI
jgi:hypothetical protein